MEITYEKLGIFIPESDFDLIEREILPNGSIYKAVEHAKCIKAQKESFLEDGKSVWEYNRKAQKDFLEMISDCWRKNVWFPYNDERSSAFGSNFFICANPDGSEDLAKMSIVDNKRVVSTIKRLSKPRSGRFAFLNNEIKTCQVFET